jgi:hypothetical protein
MTSHQWKILARFGIFETFFTAIKRCGHPSTFSHILLDVSDVDGSSLLAKLATDMKFATAAAVVVAHHLLTCKKKTFGNAANF